jgi:LysM repeat protein
MARHAYSFAIVVMLLSFSRPLWAQQFLIYSPKQVPKEEAKQTKDGILVHSVPVQNGDSLYSIAEKLIGNGMYYPQILLFNDIKNPHDIKPGDTIKVPVPKDKPVALEKKSPVAREKLSKPSAKEQMNALAIDGIPPELGKTVSAKPHDKAPVKRVVASSVRAVKKPAAKPGSGQLSELALSEIKPAPEGTKARTATLTENRSAKVKKPLKLIQPFKEKLHAALKKQPVSEDEVRPSLASRQAEQRQAFKIPISPDEIRPVVAATRYQDMEPYQQQVYPPQPMTALETSDSQRMYEQAIKAYRQDDCISALDLFGNFIATYPDLPQASDATLYKAECFMKLSRQ